MKEICPEMNINIETSIYLAMTFLYGIGMIEVKDKKDKVGGKII